MDYELGKWLERIEQKIDALLVKLYPAEEEGEKGAKQEGKK